MKSFLQLAVDAAIASGKKQPEKNRLFAAMYMWAVQAYRGRRVDARGYLPYGHDLYIVPKLRDDRRYYGGDTFPVPPKKFWSGYGATSDQYLSLGEEHVSRMLSISNSTGFAFREGNRILDLGCAAGRMIRWLGKVAAQCEIWGLISMRVVSNGVNRA